MSVAVVEASGTWREIGRVYGEELRDGIRRGLAFYADIATKLGGTVAELHERLGPYIAEARTHAPVRLAELDGMAEGANVRLEDAMLMNCVEELTSIEACTTAGKGRFLVHAEMWYAEQTDISILVARPNDGPPVVVASCVGFLTGVGASASGFAQGVQSASATDERAGVPRVMPSRDALCAASADAALAAACAERTGGYSYVVSTLNRHRVIETSGDAGGDPDRRATQRPHEPLPLVAGGGRCAERARLEATTRYGRSRPSRRVPRDAPRLPGTSAPRRVPPLPVKRVGNDLRVRL